MKISEIIQGMIHQSIDAQFLYLYCSDTKSVPFGPLPGGMNSQSHSGKRHKKSYICFTKAWEQMPYYVKGDSKGEFTFFLGMCGIAYDDMRDMPHQSYMAKLSFAKQMSELIGI